MHRIGGKNQNAKIFSPGVRKFLIPISIPDKFEDPNVNRTIKIINIYNLLAILSFIIATIALLNNK